MTRILMCPPTKFGVTYDINPWMTQHVGAPTPNAQRQWERLVDMLLVAGDVRIEFIDAQPDVPDLVFTANAALVYGNRALVSTFRHPERQREEPHYRAYLKSMGFKTSSLAGTMFEGAGDALFDRAQPLLYLGYGWRSEAAAKVPIASLTGVQVVPLRLVDPRFYHLDTCLCPLASGHVMAFLPAFAPRSQTRLRALLGARLIEVSEEDAVAFACNAVEIENAVVLHSASDTLRRRLHAAGYSIYATDLSDFHKSGGSAKCLTLKLDDGPPAPSRTMTQTG